MKDCLALIMAGGCDSWGKSRCELLWKLPRCIDQSQPSLVDDLPQVRLPELSDAEALANEYDFSGVTSGASPAALFRRALTEAGALPSSRLADAPDGAWVRVGGQKIVFQRPGSAKGFVFVTLSDEWGLMNLVIRPPLYRKYRLYLAAPGLLAEGKVERDDGVVNVVVSQVWPLFPQAC